MKIACPVCDGFASLLYIQDEEIKDEKSNSWVISVEYYVCDSCEYEFTIPDFED
jgi:uncharacterized protein YbaR (Trm112 family)